jgi:hypothetical protein
MVAHVTIERRDFIEHASTRFVPLIPRVYFDEKPPLEPHEPISRSCEECRWEDVCLGDGICWEATRIAREAARRAGG